MSAALAGHKPVDERVRARLARGLNRVMTGLLVENSDRIFAASSGGFTQSRICVLCDLEAPARRSGGVGMQVRIDPQTERPGHRHGAGARPIGLSHAQPHTGAL